MLSKLQLEGSQPGEGLDEFVVEPLWVGGEVRNVCAHELSYVVPRELHGYATVKVPEQNI